MNRFLNIAGRMLLTLLFVLLIVYGWAFLEMKIFLKSYPQLFGYTFYLQTNDEMSPDFNDQDIILVKNFEDYEVGDRVMYMTKDGEYNIRLVTSTEMFTVNVKCATCEENVTSIDKSTVTGKAVGKIKGFGHIIGFFKQKWFLITLAVIGFGFVIASETIHEAPKKIS